MRGRFGIESIHGIRSTENNHRDKLRDCENFIGIESIHGIRSTENNHRDKLRDCENFLGTESIHGIRSTENNHRDKLRDCDKCFEWEDRIEEPYRGYSLLVLDTQCSK